MSQPQPPLDERGEAHDALRSAVANFGPRVLQNPQMLGNVVTDLLPDLPRERSLLIAAAEADVASELGQHVQGQHIDPDTAVQLIARGLTERKSIDATASMWVTTEYARALGYPVQPSVPPSTPNYRERSSSSPPGAFRAPGTEGTPSAPRTTPGPGGAGPGGTGPGGTGPGEPWSRPSGGNRSYRGLLIGGIGAAAALVIFLVTALATHMFSPTPPAAPTPTQQPPTHSPPTSVTVSPPPVTVSPSPDPTRVAQQIADFVVNGNGSTVGVMTRSYDGATATRATCDPRTVSNPPDPSTPTIASCDITYSDGTIWQQTVTIEFDSGGTPISDSTNSGTELG